MLINVLRDEQPTHIGVAFDISRQTFRSDEYAEYKANRSKSPNEFSGQVSLVKEVLGALRIATIEKDGYEADDVIGTLSERAAEDGMATDIVTGDRDLFQLVDDARSVRVLYTARGVGKHEVVDEAAVVRKYAVLPEQYADFATMRGDNSDGLPGVPGVGDKTAASLLRTYGDLDSIVAAAAADASPMSATVRGRFLAAADYLTVAPRVVAVCRDLDLGSPVLDLPSPAPRDPERFEALKERWGLGGAADRVVEALMSRS
jgi:5'-3' exonuclease